MLIRFLYNIHHTLIIRVCTKRSLSHERTGSIIAYEQYTRRIPGAPRIYECIPSVEVKTLPPLLQSVGVTKTATKVALSFELHLK